MAISRRFTVQMRDVFPAGCFLVGPVEPVMDFKAPQRPDGSRPQATDPDTGELAWSVQVLDLDPEARRSEKTVTVKLYARHQPVPPAAPTPEQPVVPVQFDGLSVTPWVDTNGSRPQVKWSIRADGFSAPARKQAAA